MSWFELALLRGDIISKWSEFIEWIAKYWPFFVVPALMIELHNRGKQLDAIGKMVYDMWEKQNPLNTDYENDEDVR